LNHKGNSKASHGRPKIIKVIPMKYYGYLQGHKVIVNGVKYPRAKGEWFTELNPEKAVKIALDRAKL
jgi:hypothetical protein